MTQYARPNSDISETGWSGSYEDINESTPNDGDYITGSPDVNGAGVYGLSSVTDPESSSSHTVKFRAWQQNNTFQRYLDVDLLEDTSVISSYSSTITLVKGTPTAYEWTLSSGEADSISDYSLLRLRFTSSGDVGTPAPNRSAIYVSWGELGVPDAPGGSGKPAHMDHYARLRRS